jgi:leucyl-tRNA synthetase
VPVPEQDLPVVLPEDVVIDGSGSPLKKMDDFVNCSCPSCGKDAKRETDTFDTFMESSWYYARYACRDQAESMLDERANYWAPVDQYIGGIEHAILHLLYARFFHKVMRDVGLVNSKEPFARLLTQGMVLADSFYHLDEKGGQNWVSPLDVEIQRNDKGQITAASHKETGQTLQFDGMSKMSKSKNNGIDPQVMIDRFGADTVRLFIMFAAPPEQSLEWQDSAVEGAHRFIKRLWKQVHQHCATGQTPSLDTASLTNAQKALRRKLHQTIEKVSDDIGRRYTFNTAIAAIMELLNALAKSPAAKDNDRALLQEAYEAVIVMLAPITPHVCESLWETLGKTSNLLDESWPTADASALVEDTKELVLQVNGKLRGKISVPADTPKDSIEAQALENPGVKKFTEGKTIRKIIVVPGKLVNIVAN